MQLYCAINHKDLVEMWMKYDTTSGQLEAEDETDSHYTPTLAYATELIKSATHVFRSWPLYSIPRTSVPWEHVPGVSLLGDAAHLT